MALTQAFLLLTSVFVASGQRPFFAGSRPIGYPELLNRTTTPSGLEDKFGEGTTQRLPIEAQGDRDLIDRLSKLPIDNQPFWFINWQALEAQREKPQTYPQRPNPFFEPDYPNTNSVPQTQNSNPGFTNTNSGIVNTNPGFVNSNRNTNSGVPSAFPSNTVNSNSGSRVQPQNPKVQDPLNTKTSISNVDNRYGNEASTTVSTVIDTVTSSTAQDPVKTNSGNSNNGNPSSTGGITENKNSKPIIDIKGPVPVYPGLSSTNPTNKSAEKSTVAAEDEFEDIQVKKLGKNN